MNSKFLLLALLVALLALVAHASIEELSDEDAMVLSIVAALSDSEEGEAEAESDSEDALSSAGEAAAKFALAQQGACYSQASRLGPNSYDCSGLMLVAWKNAGYKSTS